MATNKFALATTTGRPKKDDPNALEKKNIILIINKKHAIDSIFM